MSAQLKEDLNSLRLDRSATRPASRGGLWVVVVLAVLAAVAMGGFYLQRQLATIAVEIVKPTVTRAGETRGAAALLTASGYLVPRRKAVVSAKIQGRLSELRVEEGSRVKEGDVLAKLESSSYAAQVARSRAAVERALADLAEQQRQRDLALRLSREGVASDDQRDAAESRVRLAQAVLGQARADLVYAEAVFQDTVIKAPFAGTVVKKMAEVGESVAPIPPGVNLSTSSGAIVALADLETLEVEADVSESNVAKLQPEQPAEVAVEAFPDKRFKAVLRQIIPTADRTKATVQVKVTILDKDASLRPEMSARVNFLESAAQTASTAASSAAPLVEIPVDSVAARNGTSLVFEVVDNRVHARPVTVGEPRQGKVPVRRGLEGYETLVARPSEKLKDGDRVRVKG